MGKNARKKAARKAFAAMSNRKADYSNLPYAFHVIEYKDGQRRHLRFVSITAYKNYLKEFHGGEKPADLVLVGGDSIAELDDSKGKASRTRATNKGVGLHHGKRISTPSFNDKSPKKFTQDGFKVSDSDVWQAQNTDHKARQAIESGQVRPSHKGKLEAIRQKYRTI